MDRTHAVHKNKQFSTKLTQLKIRKYLILEMEEEKENENFRSSSLKVGLG